MNNYNSVAITAVLVRMAVISRRNDEKSFFDRRIQSSLGGRNDSACIICEQRLTIVDCRRFFLLNPIGFNYNNPQFNWGG